MPEPKFPTKSVGLQIVVLEPAVSRNITSSKSKGIGAWTDAQIKTVITTGVDKDGNHLKPPMGFQYYAGMTADDLDAVVAYLRTVPAKE